MFTKSKHISKSTNKIDIKANWNVAKILNKSDVEEMKQRLSTIQNGVVERINDRFIQSTNFVCPICGGKLVKRGKSTEGFQRYHCLVCKKNMISNYDTIFYHNKLKL
jgi:transposase-like protein